METKNFNDLMTCEQFCEYFTSLDFGTKYAIAKEYGAQYGCGDEPYDFDDEFFDMAFEGRPMEAARAAHFGDINWSDEYIRFNAYGNLESMSVYDVEDWCDDLAEDIYNCDNFEDIVGNLISYDDLAEYLGVTFEEVESCFA